MHLSACEKLSIGSFPRKGFYRATVRDFDPVEQRKVKRLIEDMLSAPPEFGFSIYVQILDQEISRTDIPDFYLTSFVYESREHQQIKDLFTLKFSGTKQIPSIEILGTVTRLCETGSGAELQFSEGTTVVIHFNFEKPGDHFNDKWNKYFS